MRPRISIRGSVCQSIHGSFRFCCMRYEVWGIKVWVLCRKENHFSFPMRPRISIRGSVYIRLSSHRFNLRILHRNHSGMNPEIWKKIILQFIKFCCTRLLSKCEFYAEGKNTQTVTMTITSKKTSDSLILMTYEYWAQLIADCAIQISGASIPENS